MKLIIAGSRDLHPSERFIESLIIDFGLHNDVEELVTGKANGVDTAGENWKEVYRTYMTVKEFPYKSELGKAGGPVRNREMAEYSDALLLIWDGLSKGSCNMKENMIKLNKPIYEVIIRIHNE